MRRMYSLNQLQEIALKKIESTTNLKVFENIVDKDGHARFIEGNGTPVADIGITSAYCKWSLSGSHLMMVFAGTIANETTLSNGQQIVRFSLPEWILAKIYPVWSTNRLELRTIQVIANDWTSQNMSIVFDKTASYISMTIVNNFTATADRNFRIAFDLLIDNE